MATTRHGSSKERAGALASSPQLEDLNMAKRSHPRRGSMAFSPRKRASRHFGLVNAWRRMMQGTSASKDSLAGKLA